MTTQGALGDYVEYQALNLTFKYGGTYTRNNVYLHLYYDDPTDDDTGTTVSGGGYAAKVCPTFTQVVGYPGKFENSASIVFNEATADWGHITHVAIRSSSNEGTSTMFFHGELETHKDIDEGDTFIIPEGKMHIVLSGAWGPNTDEYYKVKVLDGFLNQGSKTFPVPNTYIALIDQNGTEITGGNYARMLLGRYWSDASSGSMSNTRVISSNQATADWGYIYSMKLYDSSNRVMMEYELLEPQYVGLGDKFRFDIESIKVWADWSTYE